MVITDAYDGLIIANNMINKDAIKKTLLQEVTMGQAKPLKMLSGRKDSDFMVLAVHDVNHSQVPMFFHPFLLELPGRLPIVAIDLRPYHNLVRLSEGEDGDEQIDFVRPDPNISQLVLYALLTGIWQKRPSDVISFNDLPMTVYGSWTAMNVGRRLDLSPDVTAKVMMTMQLFYTLRGFTGELKPEEAQTLAMALSRKLRVDLNSHFQLIQKMSHESYANLTGILQYIADQSWSVRLDKLKSADLFNILRVSWLGGANPVSMVTTATEYPPAFISLVYTAAQHRFYQQKTSIGQVVKNLDRGNTLKAFVYALRDLIALPDFV